MSADTFLRCGHSFEPPFVTYSRGPPMAPNILISLSTAPTPEVSTPLKRKRRKDKEKNRKREKRKDPIVRASELQSQRIKRLRKKKGNKSKSLTQLKALDDANVARRQANKKRKASSRKVEKKPGNKRAKGSSSSKSSEAKKRGGHSAAALSLLNLNPSSSSASAAASSSSSPSVMSSGYVVCHWCAKDRHCADDIMCELVHVLQSDGFECDVCCPSQREGDASQEENIWQCTQCRFNMCQRCAKSTGPIDRGSAEAI